MTRTVKTPNRRAAILKALRSGRGYATSAEAVGITRETLRQWRHEDPAFAAECEHALDRAIEIMEHAVYQRGLQGDTLAAFGWLRAHAPQRWHRRQLVQVEGGEHPVTVDHVLLGRSDDERVRFYMPDNGRAQPDADAPPLIEIEGKVEDAA
jgi:hypothetical protein